MKPATSLLLACAFLASAGAHAQSRGQQYYTTCLTLAEQEYHACRRDDHIRGGGCRFGFQHEKDRCWNAYQQVERDTASPYYPAPQRFEPVPIPQRPVYVLPGMR